MKAFPCDSCGAHKPVQLPEAKGSGMVRCGRCQFIYRKRRPVGRELKKIYGNEWYFTGRYCEGNEKVKTDYLRDKPNIMQFVKRRFATIARYKKKGRLLDIGSAMGFYLEYFKQNGWKVSGIEYSSFAAQYAREQLGVDDMFVGDVDAASYPANTFDVVTMWLIIEHLVKPEKTLHTIHRWMRKGGIIGIKTPNIGGITGRLDPRQWYQQHPEDHNVDFDPETLSDMLRKTGFQILEYETEGVYLERAFRAMGKPLPKDKKIMTALDRFYRDLARRLYIGDSLVMFGRKK